MSIFKLLNVKKKNKILLVNTNSVSIYSIFTMQNWCIFVLRMFAFFFSSKFKHNVRHIMLLLLTRSIEFV